jgi:hypothetical protein
MTLVTIIAVLIILCIIYWNTLLDKVALLLLWAKKNPTGGFFSAVGVTAVIVLVALPDAFIAIGIGSAFY